MRTKWTSCIILSWLWAGSSQNQGFLWAYRRDSIFSQLNQVHLTLPLQRHSRTYNGSLFPPLDSFSLWQSIQSESEYRVIDYSFFCSTGYSLQFIGKEIGSKREYNLLKDTQHLLPLSMMRLGETSKM